LSANFRATGTIKNPVGPRKKKVEGVWEQSDSCRQEKAKRRGRELGGGDAFL